MKRNILITTALIALTGFQIAFGQSTITKIDGSDVVWKKDQVNSMVCVNGNYNPSSSGLITIAEKCSSGVLVDSAGYSAVYQMRNNQMLNLIHSNLNNLATSVNINTESFKAMIAEIKKQNEDFNGKIQKSIVNRFDALPTTILSQMRTNKDFRQEVLNLLLTDESFKSEIDQIKKDIIEELKAKVSSVNSVRPVKNLAKKNPKRKHTVLAKNTR